MIFSRYVYLKMPWKGHLDLTVPVKIMNEVNTHGRKQYIVYSSITSSTFTLTEDDIKQTPVDSEYITDITTNVKPYYKGNNSLYKFAEEWGLNSWEFDCIKRLVRCRHKGNFVEDLQKTKDLIDIYLKEYGKK
jgi:hypothetical protein